MKPLEESLPTEERNRVRREAMTAPGFYSPWLHLGFTSATGLALIAVGASLLHHVKAWEVACAIFVFLLSNATEWRLHRDVLHHRKKPFEMLYDAHTPRHHVIYTTDDMSMRERREFRLVLIPAYGILGVALLTLPLTIILWLLGLHNLTGLFLITTLGYVVSYEWLHLSYHLPPGSPIGGLRVVRFLRQSHAVHHDPRLMQRCNFNVSLPLWDLVRRTYARDREAALRALRPRSKPPA